MLVNRASSNAVQINSQISDDETNQHIYAKVSTIRHYGKSRKFRVPHGGTHGKRSAFMHTEESAFNHTSSPSWIDGLLRGKSKQGVFTADFLDENDTTLAVRDGETALLNCSVYLRHDKTVTINRPNYI